MSLSHIFQSDQQGALIWRERHSPANGELEYAEASSYSTLGTGVAELHAGQRGISTLAFSPNGALLATVDQQRPGIVWIWSMQPAPSLESILLHEQAVRQVAWHPQKQELLITSANSVVAAVGHWSPNDHPSIARVPISRTETGRYSVRWVASEQADSLAFWFWSMDEYVAGYLVKAEGGRSRFQTIYSLNRKSQQCT